MSMFISSGYCIALAFMILVLPLSWIMPAMAAAFVHELCHYLAILLCSGQTTDVGIYSFAARMELPPMCRGKELICALAGPLGGLLLCFLAPYFPRLALCAALQSLYNLLPVYPLDGGRALQCLLKLLLPPCSAEILGVFIQWSFIGVLLLVSIYAFFFLHAGILPCLAALLLVFRAKDAKMPCNRVQFALQ